MSFFGELIIIKCRGLFPHDTRSRADQLTSTYFLNSLDKVPRDNEVEWLARMHHPIQECFRSFVDSNRRLVDAESIGFAINLLSRSSYLPTIIEMPLSINPRVLIKFLSPIECLAGMK